MFAVAIGSFRGSHTHALAEAAAGTGLGVRQYASLEVARRELHRQRLRPECVVTPFGAGLQPVIRWVRERRGWDDLPVLAVVPFASERAFVDSFAGGADDAVLAHDLPGMRRRFTSLCVRSASEPAAGSGQPGGGDDGPAGQWPADERRASRRLQYATVCAFRMAGLMEPTYGLTYDVSREGLFIRTLDPPPTHSTVWVELRAFGGETVHLRGSVADRRAAGQYGGTSAPGFAVALDTRRSPAGDIANYVASYEDLLLQRGAD